MTKKILLLLTLFTSIAPQAAPNCEWKEVSATNQKIGNHTVIISRHKCYIPNWKVDDEPDIFRAVVVNNKGEILRLDDGSDKFKTIKTIKTSNNFSNNVVGFSYRSASNAGQLLKIYDDQWMYLGEIIDPINEYQARNRKGSEYKIMGFFKIHGENHIESLRSVGGECNACTQYVVDTHKVTQNKVTKINTREYDIKNYTHYKIFQNDSY